MDAVINRATGALEFTSGELLHAKKVLGDCERREENRRRDHLRKQGILKSEAEDNPEFGFKMWTFSNTEGKESDEYSLMELLPLLDKAPTLWVNSDVKGVSLRLVDALNGIEVLGKLVERSIKAERNWETARKARDDAREKVGKFEAFKQASTACVDLCKAANCPYTASGKTLTMPKVKRMSSEDSIDPSTPITSTSGTTTPLSESLTVFNSLISNAQRKVINCPGYTHFTNFGKIDLNDPCWNCRASGKTQGPHSLRDFRYWVQESGLGLETRVLHVKQPEKEISLKELFLLFELHQMAFGIDYGGGVELVVELNRDEVGCSGKMNGGHHHHNHNHHQPKVNGFVEGEAGGKLDRVCMTDRIEKTSSRGKNFNPIDFINSLPQAKPKVKPGRQAAKVPQNHIKSPAKRGSAVQSGGVVKATEQDGSGVRENGLKSGQKPKVMSFFAAVEKGLIGNDRRKAKPVTGIKNGSRSPKTMGGEIGSTATSGGKSGSGKNHSVAVMGKRDKKGNREGGTNAKKREAGSVEGPEVADLHPRKKKLKPQSPTKVQANVLEPATNGGEFREQTASPNAKVPERSPPSETTKTVSRPSPQPVACNAGSCVEVAEAKQEEGCVPSDNAFAHSLGEAMEHPAGPLDHTKVGDGTDREPSVKQKDPGEMEIDSGGGENSDEPPKAVDYVEEQYNAVGRAMAIDEQKDCPGEKPQGGGAGIQEGKSEVKPEPCGLENGVNLDARVCTSSEAYPGRLENLLNDLATPSVPSSPVAEAIPTQPNQELDHAKRLKHILRDLKTPPATAPSSPAREAINDVINDAHEPLSSKKRVGNAAAPPSCTGSVNRSFKNRTTQLSTDLEDSESLLDVPLAARRSQQRTGFEENRRKHYGQGRRSTRKQDNNENKSTGRGRGGRRSRSFTPSTTNALTTTTSISTVTNSSRRQSSRKNRGKGTQKHSSKSVVGCARNMPFEMMLKKRMHFKAGRVGCDTLAPEREDPALKGEVRSRALRNKSRQVVRSELADASKWKITVARGQRLRLGRSGVHAWGLFATNRIEPETFVIEYTGEVVRRSVAEMRERQYEAEGLGSSYLFRLDDEYVVDATKKGGLARFINHSCNPNCYTKIITVDGQKKIGIYSRRTIQNKEELFYDYKFDYEEDDDRVVCNCGAKNCRGFMN